MYCPYCGERLSDGSSSGRCPYCKAQLQAPVTPTSLDPRQTMGSAAPTASLPDTSSGPALLPLPRPGVFRVYLVLSIISVVLSPYIYQIGGLAAIIQGNTAWKQARFQDAWDYLQVSRVLFWVGVVTNVLTLVLVIFVVVYMLQTGFNPDSFMRNFQ